MGDKGEEDMEQLDMDRGQILRRIGWALFLMVLCNIAAQVILSSLFYAYFPNFYQSEYYGVVLTMLTVMGVGYPVFLTVIRRVPDTKLSQEGPVKLTIRQFIGLFFVSVAFMYLSSLAGSIIGLLIARMKGSEMENPVAEFLDNSNLYLNAIYIAIIGPIMEEYIFRKILLNKLRRFGDLPAILFTSIAFGMYHLNLSQFIYATTLGIIFSYTVIRTNTIKYSVLIHMMINAIGSLLVPLSLENVNAMLLLSLWVIVSVVIGLTIFQKSKRGILLQAGEEQVERKTEYFLHFGTLLYLLSCAAMMLLQL